MIDYAALRVVACPQRKPAVQIMTADHRRVAVLHVKGYEDAVKVANVFVTAVRIAKLADELCVAVDREAADIGGSRRSIDILREIGPLCDQLERL